LPSLKMSRVRLRARTPPFHGGDTGSNPVRGTKEFYRHCKYSAFFMYLFALKKKSNSIFKLVL
jgi:hypothetical protein